jgi:pilus assembly protein CpaF
MIIQVQRMRDGVRRITHIVEVVGCEGDVITTQDLFTYQFTSVDKAGMLIGEYKPSGLRPKFTERAEYFGLDKALLACI